MPEDRDIADLLCEKPSQCGRSRLVKVRNSKRQIRPNLVYKNVVGAEWDDIIHRYIPRADGLVRQIEQLQPHRALEAAGPVALKSFAVPYSLDKLRRWETVQRFRDGIESLQDQSIGLTVSGLELHVSPFRQYQIPSLNIKEATGSNKTDIRARAYHSVDKSGKPVHRVANQLTANIASLTEKAMPPRRKRGRRNRNQQQQHAAAVEGENEAAVGVNNTDGEIKKKTKGDWERPAHVRYVFVSEHPSCKLYDKHPLNRKDINGKQLEMFMRRKRADIQRDVFEATDEYFDEAEENVSSAAPQPYFAPLETSSVSARLEDFVVAKKSKQPKNKKTPKLPFDAAYGRWLLRGTSVEAATSSGYASDADQDLENQVQTPMRVRDQVLPMQQVEILLPEQDIQPEALRAAYKDAYFECATLPRRFVLNVSDTVRSVMNISHGADAVKTKNIQVFVVFEMQKTTQHDLKNMTLEDFDDDVGPMARIRVWLNVLLNNHAGVIISLEKCYDSEMDLNEFLKSIVVHIGTLSIDAFPCNAQTDIPLRIRKPSFVMDLLPRSLLPTTSCLKNGQVSKVALSESHMVPKIQRQTTVVAAYHSNACSLFDYLYQECAVCFADDFDLQGMALASCDHFFCSQCWIDHAVQALDAGLVPIKCMEPDCKSTVDYDTAISLLPFALCERYADQLSERHLLSNFKNWRYCRNDRCD
uniref:RING-type domain-containing protein n=1 Tax=Plectus sambesii TaxID=2011161 RepID=A0A914WA53_9BILA